MTGLRELLPKTVEIEYTAGRAPDDALFPEERELLAGAVAKRRAEFAAVRFCARRALGRLGCPPAPILPGPHREPRWPAGVVGSMTHCDGYRAAAVARSEDVLAIGIDAEMHEPLPEGVTELILVGRERRRLACLAAEDHRIAWDRLVFSAKESIYKAWYPLARSWLDFTECEIDVSPDGVFVGRLLVPGPVVEDRQIEQFTGRWRIDGRHLLTAVWEPVRTRLRV